MRYQLAYFRLQKLTEEVKKNHKIWSKDRLDCTEFTYKAENRSQGGQS